jgi:hypothetical protein
MAIMNVKIISSKIENIGEMASMKANRNERNGINKRISNEIINNQ